MTKAWVEELRFARTKGKTEVTWTTDSSLPFFLFWMKKSMEGFVGMKLARAPEMGVFVMRPTGSYRHLGNGRAAGVKMRWLRFAFR